MATHAERLRNMRRVSPVQFGELSANYPKVSEGVMQGRWAASRAFVTVLIISVSHSTPVLSGPVSLGLHFL